MKPAYLHASATFSEDRVYRYSLVRRLGMGERTVTFVGLNPSTATEDTDDPTIRRIVEFARRWGFDWLLMGNLYAYRSTDPNVLKRLDELESVGPMNQDVLHWMTRKAELVVAAWGANRLNPYAITLASRILALPHTRCLGLNKDGTPKHPLYLKASTQPRPISKYWGKS